MLPWAEMMRSAVLIGIGPDQFWQLSLTEWLWLSSRGEPALNRHGFEALAARFPDKKELGDG
ncbi:MAG: phage tail assembly chaperone [Henriciella sp.]|uniref:phage tail assembly chaperone n=1 Tax=Henriciella sp. TaxID=1968823 RepID=UPI003C74F3A0